jgi:DNA-binding NarL/FixJ family response regulator
VALSAKEAAVAALVAKGCTNAQIAADLFISPSTVANHVSRLLVKLDLRNRNELARWAEEDGAFIAGRVLSTAQLQPRTGA